MKTFNVAGWLSLPANLEVRYERSFLLDLKDLEASAFQRVQQFAFYEVCQTVKIQDLPDLRQLGSSEIFYRFTLDNYLISLEITGQIVKFLRILPKPDV
jgi:DNA replicative helicase MCM subunit Mcm2 (Cdc46/Mcm family)